MPHGAKLMDLEHIVTGIVKDRDHDLVMQARYNSEIGMKCVIITKQDLSSYGDLPKIEDLENPDDSSIVGGARYEGIYILSDMDYFNNSNVSDIVAGYSSVSYVLDRSIKSVLKKNTQLLVSVKSE